MKTHPLGCIFVLEAGMEAVNTKTHLSRCAFVLETGVETAARQRT
jgi:hypothetical protein